MSQTVLWEFNDRPVHCFSEHGAYITHNATLLLGDITVGNISDYIQPPLEPQKALYYCFHMCNSAPQDLLVDLNM